MVKVSVIVPAYNAEKTLGECLDSLLSQDYADYEVIVVDDGSKDNTRGVVESYKDERLVYIRQSNGGVSAARNAGIRHAHGEYIIFCDADDYVSTHYVRTLMENADGNSLVICAMTMIRKALDTEDVDTKSAKFNYLHSPDMLERYLEGPCCKLFKKSILQQYGIQFDCNLCYAEDTTFNYEHLYVVKRVVYINQILYFYNHENSSLTKFVDDWTIDSFLAHAEFVCEWLAKGSLDETPIVVCCYRRITNLYCILSLQVYAYLPYRRAYALQTKMRRHPFICTCIKNCPWERMNDFPGMRQKIKLLVTLNNGVIWRLLGLLKRCKDCVSRRFRR